MNLTVTFDVSNKDVNSFQITLSYIRNLHTNQPTGEHFNLPGHELYHLKVSVLEKVWDHGRSLLEVRESKYIRDFMTELRGINKKKVFI